MIISVSTASGLEAVAKRELIKYGVASGSLPALNGRISFEGDAKSLAECNMLLGSVGRVYVKLAEFACNDFDTLFDGVSSVEWEKYIAENGRLLFDVKLTDSKLHALTAVQAVAKKAILNRLSKKYKTKIFPENGTRYKIEISIRRDYAVVSLDTSGDGLNKRGYRTLVGEAQLKETLASALIDLSVWNEERPFADIFCGTGTIAIEAARKAAGIAPGLYRDFDFRHHLYYDEKAFDAVKTAAQKRVNLGVKTVVLASDIDENQLRLCHKHARKAGVGDILKISLADMSGFNSDLKRGVVISNPPYGERISDRTDIEKLYSLLGRVARRNPDWCFYTLTPVTDFERLFGKKANKKRKLYNGNIECFYYAHLSEPLKK